MYVFIKQSWCYLWNIFFLMQYATETSRVADINLAKIIASRMENNKNVRILDVCAGTGLLGVQVIDNLLIFHLVMISRIFNSTNIECVFQSSLNPRPHVCYIATIATVVGSSTGSSACSNYPTILHSQMLAPHTVGTILRYLVSRLRNGWYNHWANTAGRCKKLGEKSLSSC